MIDVIKLPGDRVRFQKQSVSIVEHPEGLVSAAAPDGGVMKTDWFYLLGAKAATLYVIPSAEINVTLELAVGLKYADGEVDFGSSDIVRLVSATVPAAGPITAPVTGLVLDVSIVVAPYLRVLGPDGTTDFTAYLWLRK